MSVGIINASKFVTSGSKAFGKFIDYIDRDDAIENSNFASADFNLFADYMDDSEKSEGLFDSTGRFLSKDDKIKIKKVFANAQENGSCLWQQVYSFDMDWLKENGIFDADKNFFNEAQLREYTVLAVEKMLKTEEFEKAAWVASIHHNTEHMHIHVAMVDTNVMWTENEGRCRRDLSGNLYQRGKIKQKSIEAGKSEFVAQIVGDKEMNTAINEIIRNRIIATTKEKLPEIYFDKEIQDAFLHLVQKLPHDDLRLLKYGNNAMKSYKTEIDNLSKLIITKNFTSEINELQDLLNQKADIYKKAYGDSGRNYATGKMDELYSRLGNTILRECTKIIKYGTENPTARVDYQNEKINFSVNRISGQQLRTSISQLRRAFGKDIESMKNEAKYLELAREQGYDL